MKTLRMFLLTLLVAVTITGAASAEIYKWTDQNGVLHFGDVPPPQGGTRVELQPIPPRDETSQDTDLPSPPARRPKRLSQQPPAFAASDPDNAEVELYTTSWCGYCQKAREFFHARGIPFAEYDIEADEEAAQRKQEIDSRPGVPLAVINGRPILGFSPAAYEQALASRPE